MDDIWTTDVSFKEDGHEYTISVWLGNKKMYKITKESIVSVSTLGSYMYGEFGGKTKTNMITNTYFGLRNHYKGFVIDTNRAEWALRVPPELDLRRPEVREHFTRKSIHVPFLSYIIHHQKKCSQYYDELLLHLVESNALQYKGGHYLFASYPTDNLSHEISQFWALQGTGGTAMHRQIESYFKKEPIQEENCDFIKWKNWWKQSNIAKEWTWVASELIVHDPVLQITGSIDAVFQNKKDPSHFIILDWKRVKEITVPKGTVHTGIRVYRNSIDIVPKTDRTHEIGHRPLDKYFIQVGLYRYLMLHNFPHGIVRSHQSVFSQHPRVVDIAILNVEPRGNNGVRMYIPTINDNVDLKVSAILAKRKEELY